MTKSKIGFHTGPGGNKTGLGKWMDALNSAGIPFGLKSVDEYGPIYEATQIGKTYGIKNHLMFRLSEAANDDIKETPDYTKRPFDIRRPYCNPIIDNLPPEFDPSSVFVELFNEPRAQKDENDVQWNDLDAMEWLGRASYECAKYMNNLGYKVGVPSLNSGEPGRNGYPISDAVSQYSQPGFLKLLAYLAENPTQAMLTLHEYSWDNWKKGQGWNDWYPSLWGRLEAAYAAADNARIPRTFNIAITEWGFAHRTAPLWEEALPFISEYDAWAARWPGILYMATWTLQSGWADVDDDIQSWIEPLITYTINSNYGQGEQPQRTHNLFGGTMPKSSLVREPYHRKYWVIPDWLTEDKKRELYLKAAQEKVTCGPSFDDAGLLAHLLLSNTVTLWGIPEDEKQTYVDWYLLYYPGTDVFFESVDQPDIFSFTHWPIGNYKVNQFFAANPGNYSQYDLPGHDGTDHYAAMGAPIYAAAAGVVSSVYDNPNDAANGGHNYGIHVRVDHADGWQTIYSHLQSRQVNVGQIVDGGQIIGLADSTGNSFGSHLHLGLKRLGHTYSYETENGIVSWPYNLFDPWKFLEPLMDERLESNGVNGYAWAQSLELNFGGLYARSKGTLNLRSGPSSQSDILGKIYVSDVVKILGEKEGTGYYPVKAVPSPTQLPGYSYGGPSVSFQPFLHGPADDWAWQLGSVQSTFDDSGLKAKFLTSGVNPDYVQKYGNNDCLARIFWKPWTASPQQFWDEVKSGVGKMVAAGISRFEVHNEPNLTDEGWQTTWNDGHEFGSWLAEVIGLIKADHPTIKLYFPGVSPGPSIDGIRFDGDLFEAQALPKVAHLIDGWCLHAYTVGQTLESATSEIVTRITNRQKDLNIQVPIIVSESSHKDLSEPYNYLLKADVYKNIESLLSAMPGIEGIVWYVSSWKSPPNDHVYLSEIWEGTPLPSLYKSE